MRMSRRHAFPKVAQKQSDGKNEVSVRVVHGNPLSDNLQDFNEIIHEGNISATAETTIVTRDQSVLKSFTMTMTTAELLEHLKKVLSVKTDAKLAEMLGMTAQHSACKIEEQSIAENIVSGRTEGYDLNFYYWSNTDKNAGSAGDLVLTKAS